MTTVTTVTVVTVVVTGGRSFAESTGSRKNPGSRSCLSVYLEEGVQRSSLVARPHFSNISL